MVESKIVAEFEISKFAFLKKGVEEKEQSHKNTRIFILVRAFFKGLLQYLSNLAKDFH